ncbi:putative lipid-transfer protein DIR1 [Juglans microcarpa x Juglans regia]|uniref:putative lipid-transfer protein DIR1 n=1 Tax=Juglans microcarpa x Juglans regia TaxID=2249226 RepID=UPI001B7EAC5B|nr:putative lipid-transfer protein DIR1 [Juglans microcarpa x Juglans regia]
MEGGYKKLVFVALMVVFMVMMGSETIMLANGQTLCRMTKEGLKACEPSVSGLFPVPPSAACCSALSNADMQCLCLFKNSRLFNLYGIDPNLAFELPAKCNLPQFHCSN